MGHVKLFIPGPVEVSKKTFEAFCRPMVGHRSKDFQELYASIQPRLRELFKTTRPVYLSTSSAWGVMEAAIRSAHFLITGRELADLKLQPLRGMQGAKELRVNIDGLELGAAVVSSLGQARKLLDQIRAGRKDLHFIEVMTCPGGCINGGGQPLNADIEAVRSRMQALYKIDQDEAVRVSHRNAYVMRLYDEFLGKPLGETSHRLLHTHYAKRDVVL